MQVSLKNLLPNPFRNLPHYPIDRAKIKKLKSSIKRTGFWDNIVGRPRPSGKFEIGYGHHRRVALLEMYPGTHMVGVISRKLDDGTMIKVMADENDEIYNLSPAVINETVKAARDFLRAHPKESPRRAAREKGSCKVEAPRIARFLDWSQKRVEEALASLSAFGKKLGTVDEEAYELIPSQEAARTFRRKVQKHKAPPAVQRSVAKKLQAGLRGEPEGIKTKEIGKAITDEMYLPPEKKKLVEFEDFLERGAEKIETAASFLHGLAEFRSDFDSKIYAGTIERFKVEAACRRFWLGYDRAFHKGERKTDGKTHHKSLPLPRHTHK